MEAGDWRALSRLLIGYHARRARAAGDLVEMAALHRRTTAPTKVR